MQGFLHHNNLYFSFQQLPEHAESQYWPSVLKDKLHQDLRMLSFCVAAQEECVPMQITEEHFEPTVPLNRQHYYLLKKIALEVPCIAFW